MNKSSLAKLRSEHDHLLQRTFDLFKFGMAEEAKLRGGIENARRGFDLILKANTLDEAKDLAGEFEELMRTRFIAVPETTQHEN